MDEATTGTSTPANDAGEPKSDGQAVAPASDASATPPEDPKPTEATVPEDYTFTMPDGVELDSAAADEFKAIAKELKLDQASAQKVADVGAKMAQRQVEQHTKLVETWVEQVKVDKEIGGDKLQENLAVAKRALETFGTPELRDVLNMSGLGNHPEVIRAFYKAGKAISEDRFVQGAPTATPIDPARKMFPNMN